MKEFAITKEMIQSATTYMPLEDKIAYARQIAEQCVTEYKGDKNEIISLVPPVYREDAFLKEILMQNVLLGYYLNVEIGQAKGEDVIKETYDPYAKVNIIGNLMRFKSDADVRERCFDLLDDYTKFERLTNAEIREIKAVKNDLLARAVALLSVTADPETLKKLTEEMQKNTGAEVKE